MTKSELEKNWHTNLQSHPAYLAWRELQFDAREPRRIDILKGKFPTNNQMLKRLVCRMEGLDHSGAAIIGKRCKRADAMVENIVYKEILPHIPVSSLRYFGMIEEEACDYNWIFIEDAGERAYFSHLKNHCQLNARWLAHMHRFAIDIDATVSLPDKGPKHYLKRLKSVRDAIQYELLNLPLKPYDLALLEIILGRCDVLKLHWERVDDLCKKMPRTLVHGDFIARNLRVRTHRKGIILLPFDWSEAGFGIPAIDSVHADLPTYWKLMREYWPNLHARYFNNSVIVGKIFRCIDAIYWQIPSFQYRWLEKPMDNMRIYESWLTSIMRETGFER